MRKSMMLLAVAAATGKTVTVSYRLDFPAYGRVSPKLNGKYRAWAYVNPA